MLRRASQILVAPLIAALVFVPVSAPAADHVVSGADVSARLGEAAAARQADLAELNGFLGSRLGQQAAHVVGADTTALQARLAHLMTLRTTSPVGRGPRADPAAGNERAAIAWIIVGGVRWSSGDRADRGRLKTSMTLRPLLSHNPSLLVMIGPVPHGSRPDSGAGAQRAEAPPGTL
jgi:hypothetical protein